ncbi:MAG: addiction module protein [Verrucomicrobiae bacterium]|nr:addiction module protein [Verrucomicrobiae bacterium]
MTIPHQTVFDAEGNPTAALISWDDFQIIRAELEDAEDAPLSPQWRAEIERRVKDVDEGRAKLIPHEEVVTSVREKLQEVRRTKQP